MYRTLYACTVLFHRFVFVLESQHSRNSSPFGLLSVATRLLLFSLTHGEQMQRLSKIVILFSFFGRENESSQVIESFGSIVFGLHLISATMA